MCHVAKILLRIILNKWKSKIRNEVSEIQYGFFEGKAPGLQSSFIERSIEMQSDLHASFINYTKSSNRPKVSHEEIYKILLQPHFDKNDIPLTVNLYWD